MRDYAAQQKEIEAGMHESAEFRQRGGEVYLPGEVTAATDADVATEDAVAD